MAFARPRRSAGSAEDAFSPADKPPPQLSFLPQLRLVQGKAAHGEGFAFVCAANDDSIVEGLSARCAVRAIDAAPGPWQSVEPRGRNARAA